MLIFKNLYLHMHSYRCNFPIHSRHNYHLTLLLWHTNSECDQRKCNFHKVFLWTWMETHMKHYFLVHLRSYKYSWNRFWFHLNEGMNYGCLNGDRNALWMRYLSHNWLIHYHLIFTYFWLAIFHRLLSTNETPFRNQA